MKPNGCCGISFRTIAYIIAIAGAFLIVAALAGLLRHYTRTEPIGGNRAEERSKSLAELRASEVNVLQNLAWQDQAKQVVRLPIKRAMELTLQEYKNPAVARSNMVARIDQLTAPPPKEPEKPSEFE